jgi:hypothetical protein
MTSKGRVDKHLDNIQTVAISIYWMWCSVDPACSRRYEKVHCSLSLQFPYAQLYETGGFTAAITLRIPLLTPSAPKALRFPSLYTIYLSLSASSTPYQHIPRNPTKFVKLLTPCSTPNFLFSSCISLLCGPSSQLFFPSRVS